MASASQTSPAEATVSPTAALDQTLSLLQAKDDTRRFVGISLLRTILDKHESLRNDPVVILRCWNAIPTSFLKRLLKARPSEQRGEEEARNMVTLAVSVVQAFTTLLDAGELEDERVISLCGGLVAALKVTADDSRVLALQALYRVGGASKGALEIIQAGDSEALVDLARKDDLALDVVKTLLITLIKGAKDQESASKIFKLEDAVFSTLLVDDEPENKPRILQALAEVLEESEFARIPNWLPSLTRDIHHAFLAHPSNKLCRTCTRLIHHFTTLSPSYDPFFPSRSTPSTSKSANTNSSQPFSYLFTTFILIDIRSTIPSLLEILGSPKYPSTALRLAASFDVLGAFIGTLVALWDSDSPSPDPARPKHTLDIPPTQLLTLRKSLAETASLTLEYLRDRFDASLTGTSGLHSSAIAGGSEQQKTLTWESPTVALEDDPVVLAGSRVLALWVREDENAQLRTEASGCMDVWLHIYGVSGGSRTEFRPHVLLALEGIMTVPAGVETFLEQEGWRMLVRDLQACMTASSGGYPYRVLSIIRVLLAVAESEELSQTKESWLGFISFLAGLPSPALPASRRNLHLENGDLDPVEVWTAAGQLAVALVLKAPRRLQRKFKGECDGICKVATGLLKQGREKLDNDSVEGLKEVIDGFGELDP